MSDPSAMRRSLLEGSYPIDEDAGQIRVRVVAPGPPRSQDNIEQSTQPGLHHRGVARNCAVKIYGLPTNTTAGDVFRAIRNTGKIYELELYIIANQRLSRNYARVVYWESNGANTCVQRGTLRLRPTGTVDFPSTLSTETNVVAIFDDLRPECLHQPHFRSRVVVVSSGDSSLVEPAYLKGVFESQFRRTLETRQREQHQQQALEGFQRQQQGTSTSADQAQIQHPQQSEQDNFLFEVEEMPRMSFDPSTGRYTVTWYFTSYLNHAKVVFDILDGDRRYTVRYGRDLCERRG